MDISYSIPDNFLNEYLLFQLQVENALWFYSYGFKQ